MLQITGSRLDKTDRISIDHVTIDYATHSPSCPNVRYPHNPPAVLRGFKTFQNSSALVATVSLRLQRLEEKGLIVRRGKSSTDPRAIWLLND